MMLTYLPECVLIDMPIVGTQLIVSPYLISSHNEIVNEPTELEFSFDLLDLKTEEGKKNFEENGPYYIASFFGDNISTQNKFINALELELNTTEVDYTNKPYQIIVVIYDPDKLYETFEEYGICTKDDPSVDTKDKCLEMFGLSQNTAFAGNHYILNYLGPEEEMLWEQMIPNWDDDLMGIIGGANSIIYDIPYPCFTKKGYVHSFTDQVSYDGKPNEQQCISAESYEKISH